MRKLLTSLLGDQRRSPRPAGLSLPPSSGCLHPRPRSTGPCCGHCVKKKTEPLAERGTLRTRPCLGPIVSGGWLDKRRSVCLASHSTMADGSIISCVFGAGAVSGFDMLVVEGLVQSAVDPGFCGRLATVRLPVSLPDGTSGSRRRERRRSMDPDSPSLLPNRAVAGEAVCLVPVMAKITSCKSRFRDQCYRGSQPCQCACVSPDRLGRRPETGRQCFLFHRRTIVRTISGPLVTRCKAAPSASILPISRLQLPIMQLDPGCNAAAHLHHARHGLAIREAGPSATSRGSQESFTLMKRHTVAVRRGRRRRPRGGLTVAMTFAARNQEQINTRLTGLGCQNFSTASDRREPVAFLAGGKAGVGGSRLTWRNLGCVVH